MMRRAGWRMQGRWVRGIVDQLQLDQGGRLQVVEHKTRAAPTLPRDAQASPDMSSRHISPFCLLRCLEQKPLNIPQDLHSMI